MPHDADGKRLSEGNRVTIQAIVEEASPGPGAELVEVRLIVPEGGHAPRLLIYSAACRKVEAQP